MNAENNYSSSSLYSLAKSPICLNFSITFLRDFYSLTGPISNFDWRSQCNTFEGFRWGGGDFCTIIRFLIYAVAKRTGKCI